VHAHALQPMSRLQARFLRDHPELGTFAHGVIGIC
jgi:hypothetical protein